MISQLLENSYQRIVIREQLLENSYQVYYDIIVIREQLLENSFIIFNRKNKEKIERKNIEVYYDTP